jgi:hypothetical protein
MGYANKQQQKEYHAEWARNNKEKMAAYTRDKYRRTQTDPKLFVSWMLRMIRQRARKYGHDFSLTNEDLTKLFIKSNGKCALSGLPLTVERKNPLIASVDRINSDKGYVKGNVQLVASCVNLAKHKLSQRDFIKMCKAVVDNNS